MLDELIHIILPTIISLLELIGIFVVVVSASIAFLHYLSNVFKKGDFKIQYDLATGLATGLEFKMAAEILKTVLVRDLNELFILGAVILLRGLLSLLIYFELKQSKNH